MTTARQDDALRLRSLGGFPGAHMDGHALTSHRRRRVPFAHGVMTDNGASSLWSRSR
ncbi:MAG TPA: hypothetical protein VGC11_03670 [Acidimicrobiia bacterium]